ncbi:MAG: aminotransferase class V-fold PLP-dependent enzyme [Iamia sp.]
MTSPAPPTRADAVALDRVNPLARFRDRFVGLGDDAYLMGNSLGPLPAATEARLVELTREGWGGRKVEGWDEWLDLPTRVGDRLGRLLGAGPGQVVVGDSTSVQLFKLLHAALDGRPEATAVAVADDEFPTDRYLVDGVAGSRGLEVRTVPTDGPDGPVTAAAVSEVCDDGAVGVLLASLVRYRTSARADMAAVTAAAQDGGALVLWDLSHAAGSVPVDLDGTGTDLAVGCTYKYLNAGPGAPAFAYRARRHADLHQPIHGWFGQADQFATEAAYDPHPDARQLLVGTPPVAGLLAVDEGLALHEEAGADRTDAVGRSLMALVTTAAQAALVPLGVAVATPLDPACRGQHLALRHHDARALVASLAGDGIVADHREPDVVRLAAAPLHTRFVDLWDAVESLRRQLTS